MSFDWRIRAFFAALLLFWIFALGCSGATKPQRKKAPTKQVKKSARKSPQVQTQLRFTNITQQAGIRFRYQSGADANECTMLETLGGGVALFDYDLDGQLDIFATGGGDLREQRITGRPGRLYRNLGNGKFADVTQQSGLDLAGRYSHGAFVADYDNDGDPDLLVTGYGGLALFRNNGEGTFSELSQPAGLRDSQWSTSAAWGDLNGDGLLDLYVAHYVDWSFQKHPRCNARQQGTLAGGSRKRDVCSPKQFDGLRDSLYLNRGDGTFTDASQQLNTTMGGKGLGVLIADIELDGDVDVYVTNDTIANFLFRNNGKTLEEVGKLSGAGYGNQGNEDGSMGIGLGDVNRDGIPDICVSNFQNENYAMYRGLGRGRFIYSSAQAGLKQVGNRYVGWGMAFSDFDQDGDEDLVATNGHVLKFPDSAPRKQRPFLFENRQLGRLTNVAAAAGDYFSSSHEGRGLAVGDLDGDGDGDVVISDISEGIIVLCNDSAQLGHWLQVRLIGTAGNRDAIGAIVELRSGHKQIRQRFSGGSYASTSSPRIHFGLGSTSSIESLVIRWPSGKKSSIPNPSERIDSVITVVEPD